MNAISCQMSFGALKASPTTWEGSLDRAEIPILGSRLSPAADSPGSPHSTCSKAVDSSQK